MHLDPLYVTVRCHAKRKFISSQHLLSLRIKKGLDGQFKIQLSELGLWNMATASLQRGKTLPNEYPGYDTKLSDGEAPVQELWEMWSTSSLPLLPVPL